MSSVMERDKSWDAVLAPGKATDYFATPRGRPVFDPECTEWHPGQAWWCSEISRAVYRRDDRQHMLQAAGLRELEFFDEGSTQAALITARDFCVLVYRGTADLRDWLTNVRVAPKAWPTGGKVHEGFASAATRIDAAVARALSTVQLPTFVTGHSLGGALATIAMSRHAFVAAYSFGAPRIGDAAFWDAIAAPVHRVVNDRDIVPTLPPRRIGYAHGGELRHLRADGTVMTHVQDDLDDGDDELEAALSRRRWFEPPNRLSDHAPINYSNRLLQLAMD